MNNTKFEGITGVHSGNDIEWYEDIDDGIYLDYEEHLKECKEYKEHGYCDCEIESSTILFPSDGWIKGNDGLYDINPNSEYSAIFNTGYNTIQVIHSKYRIYSGFCSPCYPNQLDVDSGGNNKAYMLPPDMLRNEWVKENKERFVKEGE